MPRIRQRIPYSAALLAAMALASQASSLETLEPARYTAADPAYAALQVQSEKFFALAAKANYDCDLDLDELRARRLSLFKAGQKKSQDAGNLEEVMVYDELLKDPDCGAGAGMPFVIQIASSFQKASEVIERRRTAAFLDLVRKYYAALEPMKKEETKKGNLAFAKEILECQGQLRGIVEELQAESSEDKAGPSTAGESAGFQMPAGLDVVAPANAAMGGLVGECSKGDLLLFRYKEGLWSNGAGAPLSPDDAHGDTNQDPVLFEESAPLTVLGRIPVGTAGNPFAFEVPSDGRYRIRIFDYASSPNFSDNIGQVVYTVVCIPAAQVPDYRASAGAGGDTPAMDSPAASAQPVALPAGKHVTVYATTFPGVPIGECRAGDVLVLQYQSGTWSAYNSSVASRMSPDAPDTPEPNRAFVLGQKRREWDRGLIPANTAVRPVAFTADEDGMHYLRIREASPALGKAAFADNGGQAVYKVVHISRLSAENFRNSDTGRACVWMD